VQVLAVQADGKIVAGGNFTSLGGQARGFVGRVHANGSLDSGFNPAANAAVYSLAMQANGKIVIGGDFTALEGKPRGHVGRLYPDGSAEVTFNPAPNSFVGVPAAHPGPRSIVTRIMPPVKSR